MTTTISKTVFTFTVLHRTDDPFEGGIEEALERSFDGHAVGATTGEVTTEVADAEVGSELRQLSNDGEFFDSDLDPDDDTDDTDAGPV